LVHFYVLLQATAPLLDHLSLLLFLSEFLVVFYNLLLLGFFNDMNWQLLVTSFAELLGAALRLDPGHPARSALCDNLLGLVSWELAQLLGLQLVVVELV
jgi:hypothetical protein